MGASPAPAAASTATDMGGLVLTWMNADRADRGLVPYRAWSALADLAGERAGRMADAHTLSHQVAGGNVGDALSTRGVTWLGYGEIIGTSTYPWGRDAAANIYGLWKSSTVHRSIMFSDTYNYAGVGVVQAADGSTWMSVVFAESPDHTRPTARIGSLKRSGRTLTLAWRGADPRLQTHTAGLRSFDVQKRRDGGTWKTVRDNTTATSLVLRHRKHGHWFSFRVQAADRRGNLSTWTSEKRIWVP